MIDSDNVLLLKPFDGGSGFALEGLRRAAAGERVDEASRIAATIVSLARPLDVAMRRRVGAALDSADAASGSVRLARFETEYAENSFPRLPVRIGEHVVVAFARERAGGATDDAWARSIAAIGDAVVGAPERLMLEATPRSRVR